MKALIWMVLLNLACSFIVPQIEGGSSKDMSDLTPEDQAFVKYLIAIDTSSPSVPSTDVFKGKSEDEVVSFLDEWGTFANDEVTTQAKRVEISQNVTLAKEMLASFQVFNSVNNGSETSFPMNGINGNISEAEVWKVSEGITGVTAESTPKIVGNITSDSEKNTVISEAATNETYTVTTVETHIVTATAKPKKKTSKSKKGKKKPVTIPASKKKKNKYKKTTTTLSE